MSYIVIYVTFPDKKSANKISLNLLKRKLVVCVNTFNVESGYWWKNKIERSREVASLIKTSVKNAGKVEKEILRLHPYKVPVIERIKVSANSSAEKWLRSYLK